jgi:hypothetical protein
MMKLLMDGMNPEESKTHSFEELKTFSPNEF